MVNTTSCSLSQSIQEPIDYDYYPTFQRTTRLKTNLIDLLLLTFLHLVDQVLINFLNIKIQNFSNIKKYF